MANELTIDWSELSKEIEERKKRGSKQEPKISLGKGPKFATSGGTSSQDIAKFYSEVDASKLSPAEIDQMGGKKKIAEQKEAAKKLIQSETPANKPLSITGTKPSEVKPTPKIKEKAEDTKRLWRVMLKGRDSSKDTFYDNEDDARKALAAMGGKGAVAGIRLKSKAEEEQYMEQAATGGRVATIPKDETKEDRIRRKISEVNPQATEAQKTRYLETLSKSRAKTAERETASKERAAKFRSDIAAKEASKEQLSQYNKQLSTLKRAYRDARRSGDYVEQYRLGDFINAYQAGVPKEMGARDKASRSGIIADRNKELEEKIIRDREARATAQKTSMANPDFQQFNANQFGQGIKFSQL